ncbi:MAG: fibronectin type III domain-containing protein, partial [Bacillota bacterium]|nr:fibronectin type III domain-containing protein [Bacillota bacterium]
MNYIKKLIATVLTFVMTLSMITITPVSAEENTFNPKDVYYAIVDENGNALKMRKAGGTTDKDEIVHSDTQVINNKVAAMVAFKIGTKDGYYYFECEAANNEMLKYEDGQENIFNWNDGDSPNDRNLFKLISKNNGYIIKTKNGDNYFQVTDDGIIKKESDEDKATVFTFQEVSILDSSVTIKYVKTGKYVSFADKDNNQSGTEVTKIHVVEKNDADLTDDEKFTPNYLTNDNTSFLPQGEKIDVVGFISKSKKNLTIISTNWVNGAVDEIGAKKTNPGGWESVILEPNGDGTVGIKSSYSNKYVTVNENDELEYTDETKESIENKDDLKFVVSSELVPTAAADLDAPEEDLSNDSFKLTWTNPKDCIYTGLKLLKLDDNGTFEEIADVSGKTSYTVEKLNPDTEYTFKLRSYNGTGDQALTCDSEEKVVKTLEGEKPGVPQNVQSQEKNGKIIITWDKSENANGYIVQRADSLFGKYENVKTLGDVNSYEYTYANGKYENYFKVIALNNKVKSNQSSATSLEKSLFGENVYIFAEGDDRDEMYKVMRNIYNDQSDFNANAQFNEKRYAFYFKKGDYTDLKTIPVGFYTHIAGLGATPYDVKLNNITTPAYLEENNATCNFWRSVENLTVANVKVEGDETFTYRSDYFNWGVAQAAPMRRINSERPVAYDWQYGWASGGYTADSKITGTADNNGTPISAGTYSGQQFYTRNTSITGNVYGCTLNAFFQGVDAPNLPTDNELSNNQGYTNWATPDEKGNQQIVTNVTSTPIIREKPFLYLKDGEYKVFVPSIRKDAKGTSWSENNIGEGIDKDLLEDFYIAKEGDNAVVINEQLDSKNVFFTPGVYHAEKAIEVKNKDTVVLGTGMASIIPDNDDTAMRVADKDNITVAGLIFDAGTHNSKYLLQVGAKKTGTDHKDPTLLADLFFRIGGTTKVATTAQNALEINSNNVIGDHFWIWRADHGEGVSWHGNAAQNGLIVNGDSVNCYALFNEHFEGYTTLWNGEDGATYFYQNETAYDAITQDANEEDAWLSHNGTVKGYASYKVSNNVNKHYAVGLGIYNVFIYTGGGEFNQGKYDGGKQIELDNAIEVPNKKGVTVDNACLQTFAKAGEEGGLYQSTNSIINGAGAGVSSGFKREETRAEDGSLNGRLLDKDGNPLPTKIYTIKSQNEFGANVFKYVVRELDDQGREIVYNKNKELDLDKLATNFDYKIDENTGEFKLYNKGTDQEIPSGGDGGWTNWINNEYSRTTPLSKAVRGNGWARTFLLTYNNGKAVYGKAPSNVDEFDKFIKLVTENVKQLGDDDLDLDELKALIENKKDENLYTKDSYNDYLTVYDEASKILTNDGLKYSTQKDVDNAVAKLKEAQDKLVLKVNKAELNKLYTDKKDLKETDYTTDSWKVFSDALANAKNILDKEDATQKEVDQALATLQSAVAGLKTVTNDNQGDN